MSVEQYYLDITAIEDTGSGVNKDDQQGHEVAY